MLWSNLLVVLSSLDLLWGVVSLAKYLAMNFRNEKCLVPLQENWGSSYWLVYRSRQKTQPSTKIFLASSISTSSTKCCPIGVWKQCNDFDSSGGGNSFLNDGGIDFGFSKIKNIQKESFFLVACFIATPSNDIDQNSFWEKFSIPEIILHLFMPTRTKLNKEDDKDAYWWRDRLLQYGDRCQNCSCHKKTRVEVLLKKLTVWSSKRQVKTVLPEMLQHSRQRSWKRTLNYKKKLGQRI